MPGILDDLMAKDPAPASPAPAQPQAATAAPQPAPQAAPESQDGLTEVFTYPKMRAMN